MSQAVQDESFPPNKNHHVGQPRSHFRNPWPSFREHGLSEAFMTRFGRGRNFVPVPENREGLVDVRKPDWGQGADPQGSRLKATWIGHASWLVETPTTAEASAEKKTRGIRVLFDPVFSDRTSPFTFFGPKRYTPTPCSVTELPEIDVVVISHNHYDHLDHDTIKALQTRSAKTHFMCPLGVKAWFTGLGLSDSRVTELDWWEGVDIAVEGHGAVRMVCTPAQHNSSRTGIDRDHTLWSSWALGSVPSPTSATGRKTIEVTSVEMPTSIEAAGQAPVFGGSRVFFAGDTGYRAVDKPNPTPEEAAAFPHCPAFATIGSLLGPFDLALVPIGLYSPRNFMSSFHCAPEDTALLVKDVKAKYSVGMHYGTVRGGLSAQWEDVREPPVRFREACEREGLAWGQDVGLCAVGETTVVA